MDDRSLCAIALAVKYYDFRCIGEPAMPRDDCARLGLSLRFGLMTTTNMSRLAGIATAKLLRARLWCGRPRERGHRFCSAATLASMDRMNDLRPARRSPAGV